MMTNREKYKEQILDVICDENFTGIAVREDTHIPCLCRDIDCAMCHLKGSDTCAENFARWSKEDCVDWTKVPVDAKVLVSKDGEHWEKRHFAKYENGKVFVFQLGQTSWSDSVCRLAPAEYAELAEEDAE